MSQTTQIYDYRMKLKELLQDRRLRNPSYSLRAFAKSLSMNPGDLHRLMYAEKTPNQAIIKRFLDGVDMPEEQKLAFAVSIVIHRLHGYLDSDVLGSLRSLVGLDEKTAEKVDALMDRFVADLAIVLGGPSDAKVESD